MPFGQAPRSWRSEGKLKAHPRSPIRKLGAFWPVWNQTWMNEPSSSGQLKAPVGAGRPLRSATSALAVAPSTLVCHVRHSTPAEPAFSPGYQSKSARVGASGRSWLSVTVGSGARTRQTFSVGAESGTDIAVRLAEGQGVGVV